MEKVLEKTALSIGIKLFEHLQRSKVVYCHWKSNFNLKSSLSGETDLDLLIHYKDREEFESIIYNLDFKKMLSPLNKRLPGMEDYLGFDYYTGKLIHLHVHYKLILGQRYIKNHHLPIEDFVLDNLQLVQGVFIPSTDVELLMLVIRSNMKASMWSIIKFGLNISKSPYPKNIYDEYLYLAKEYDEKRFVKCLANSGVPLDSSLISNFIQKVLRKDITFIDVIRVRQHVFESLRPFRRNNPLVCLRRYLGFNLRATKVYRSFFPTRKKTMNNGGKVFALVGADGSGKSTLRDDLCKWLSWKVVVKPIYFGIPKSPMYMPILKLPRMFRLLGRAGFGDKYRTWMSYFEKQISAMRWLFIARIRFELFEESQRFALEGGVVITDRYPLSEFSSMDFPMDGPRIRKQKEVTDPHLALREEKYYEKIRLPDKVFVLNLSFDEILKRKRENALNPGLLESKVKAVNAIKNSERVCVVDCHRPYPDVLLDLKRRIWELL